MSRMIAIVLASIMAAALIYAAGIVFDWYGELESSGRIEAGPIPDNVRVSRDSAQLRVAENLGVITTKQILFGDLHVHTTFSSDAFRMSLPMVQGDGAHPPADACDFARACAALDFWALTDHAESLTRDRWDQSVDSVRQCNDIAGDGQSPDMVTFMGFEWTQAGGTPETHYGHKNVIFRDTGPEQLPARPISSPFRAAFSSVPLNLRLFPPLRDPPGRQRYYDFNHFVQDIARQPLCPDRGHVRDLPADCAEIAPTPADLFRKLSEWEIDSIVIPHGTTWGVYSPAGTALDKQLVGAMHDPSRQTIIEIFSGHGNSEVFREWSAVKTDSNGRKSCPRPRPDYLPSCWQAGELIRGRCLDSGLPAAECEARAVDARQQYIDNGQVGWHTVPGTLLPDWLDAGQCRDCFLPSFNYRPRGSAQYGLAITNFDDPANPARFRFGFIASSDNHSARPGTGYKEYARNPMVDWWGYRDEGSRQLYSTDRGSPEPASVPVDASRIDVFNILELERQASYFVTGGLVAVHSEGRNREAIWQALKRKEVYGTSGPRMLLWFDLLSNSASDEDSVLPMGSETTMDATPRFRARAVGAFKQTPGCPEHSLNALSPERLELLCRGECYNPSSERRRIERLEVIRIRPQRYPDEPLGPLIEDPWKSFDCSASGSMGCEAEFEDPEFEAGARDAVYYLRAIQTSQSTINAGGLRCDIDEQGQCTRVNACYGDDRTDTADDCKADARHRAWSSPIFIDHARKRSEKR